MTDISMELSERNLLDLATMIAKDNKGPLRADRLNRMFKNQPPEFKKLMVACLSTGRNEKHISDTLKFIIEDGELNLDRAVSIYLIRSMGIAVEFWRYNGRAFDHKIKKWSPRPRVRDFDYIFNAVNNCRMLVPFILEVISRENIHKLNTNCRIDFAIWITESDIEITEDLIKVFLKGYFRGDEKGIIIKSLIKKNELEKLEIFWKSRAVAVQKLLVGIAPLEKLPFLLGTNNKTILDLIEKRMMELK